MVISRKWTPDSPLRRVATLGRTKDFGKYENGEALDKRMRYIIRRTIVDNGNYEPASQPTLMGMDFYELAKFTLQAEYHGVVVRDPVRFKIPSPMSDVMRHDSTSSYIQMMPDDISSPLSPLLCRTAAFFVLPPST
jgi:hypothetical protein